MDTAPMDTDSISGSRTISSGDDFGFSPESLMADSGNNSPDFMHFEASGLGGVQPEDNFSIHVRRAQVSTAPSHAAARRRSSLYPKKIQDALNRQASPEAAASPSPRASSQRVIQEKIISANHKTLPNSTLPTPSFLPFDSCSSGDVDSDLESDVSSEPDEDTSSEGGPATAMQILNIAPADESAGSDDEEESQYSEDSDDGSVDLLATARQQDPNAVRLSEREYDAALADRLAEEIPAGSSAATAGGGSGFNSPANGVAEQQQQQPAKLASEGSGNGSMDSTRAQLKRARTSESVTKVGKKSPKSRKVEE
jgi:hypothetical protein